jgi:hypothetical protein
MNASGFTSTVLSARDDFVLTGTWVALNTNLMSDLPSGHVLYSSLFVPSYWTQSDSRKAQKLSTTFEDFHG